MDKISTLYTKLTNIKKICMWIKEEILSKIIKNYRKKGNFLQVIPKLLFVF